MSDIIDEFAVEENDRSSRHANIMRQLQELDEMIPEQQTYLVSSSDSWASSQPKKKKNQIHVEDLEKESKKKKEEHPVAEWMQAFMDIEINPVKRRKRKNFILDENGELVKKKGKKKNKKGGLTDFQEVFATETSMYQTLLRDQNALVNSLQKAYDGMTATKGTNRGITKATTDMIANISTARGVSMQLVDKLVNLKKTQYDLASKEKKEQIGLSGDDNLSAFAGTLLKQAIESRTDIIAPQDYTVENMDADQMIDAMMEATNDIETNPESELYLKYENRNITVYVSMNQSNMDDWEYVAEDDNGVVCLDYPLPETNHLNINRSIMIATDEYGQKYPIRWK